jgi:hypothetical protein
MWLYFPRGVIYYDVLTLTILLERYGNSNGFEVLFLGIDPSVIDYQEGSGSYRRISINTMNSCN